jgi:CheY-like chemotaxis protein
VRVLVIDDHAPIRTTIRIKLEQCGHTVVEAENGVRGLACYRATRPDVVLMDIYMPDRDGLETLRDLLKLDPAANVLAMSGGGSYSHVRILDAARRMGARAVLPKPFSLDEMLQAVTALTPPPPPPAAPEEC